MSSSQFAIFCIILTIIFPLHKFVDSQGLGSPFKDTCTQIECPTARDKNRKCFCCGVNEERTCYADESMCAMACGRH
ncbi:hypothetical protein N665_0362s0016 [Sinapis alba]|nr:hypothetical protein N665_0362s0016 [Sinapis alba]